MATSIEILLKERVGLNLVLRDTAGSLFDLIDTSLERSFVIDFIDVESISLSFADEYTKRKGTSMKKIVERNIPSNIAKMFDVVGKSTTGRRFKDLDQAELISI
jgi:hypothetical protein